VITAAALALSLAVGAGSENAPPEKWTGSVGVGLVAITGNARTLTLAGNAAAERKGELFIFGLKALGAYGEARPAGQSASEVSALNAALFLRGDYRLTPALSVFALGGAETDQDCGGADCDGCFPGQACALPADCASGRCVAGVCQAPSCGDATQNGRETDADCGGPDCVERCAGNQKCAIDADCASQSCASGLCAAASCTDGLVNGSETGVDCGGSCPACENGLGCGGSDANCASGFCAPGVDRCADPLCGNDQPDAGETDADCGGTACDRRCATGDDCAAGSDCASGRCVSQLCAAPGCGDGVQNQLESDVDCGGPACTTEACDDGLGCYLDGDCRSGACGTGACSAPSCGDGVQNGSETAVDCGGPSCPACSDCQSCGAAADCRSTLCDGVCLPAPFLVEYLQADDSASDAEIVARFRIWNLSGAAVPLSELRFRYYYSRESAVAQTAACFLAERGSPASIDAASSFGGADPDYYVQISSDDEAWLVPDRGHCGELGVRITGATGTYDELDDYSYDPSRTDYGPAPRVILYQNQAGNWTRVWGLEP